MAYENLTYLPCHYIVLATIIDYKRRHWKSFHNVGRCRISFFWRSWNIYHYNIKNIKQNCYWKSVPFTVSISGKKFDRDVWIFIGVSIVIETGK